MEFTIGGSYNLDYIDISLVVGPGAADVNFCISVARTPHHVPSHQDV